VIAARLRAYVRACVVRVLKHADEQEACLHYTSFPKCGTATCRDDWLRQR
jgi:hypothetical protein